MVRLVLESNPEDVEVVKAQVHELIAASDINQEIDFEESVFKRIKLEVETPLLLASMVNRPDIARILIEAKADVNKGGSMGFAPLHCMANRGDLEMVRFLIENGAKVNQPDEHHSTPLSLAAQKGHAETVKALLDGNADVDQPNIKGITPLHVASYEGNLIIVELLIKNDAEVNRQDNTGATPLNRATQKGHAEIVKTLLGAEANPNLPNERGATPLYWASQYGNLKIMKALLEAEADIEQPTNDGRKPLSIAFYKGLVEEVKLLVKSGANVNIESLSNLSLLKNAQQSNKSSKEDLEKIISEIQSIEESKIDDSIDPANELKAKFAQTQQKIETIEESVAALLTSTKYGLIIQSREEKDLVMEVLAKSPLLIPHIEPIFQTIDSEGQKVESTDPDISELIEANEVTAKNVLEDMHEAFTAVTLNDHNDSLSAPDRSLYEPHIANLVFSYIADGKSYFNPHHQTSLSSAASSSAAASGGEGDYVTAALVANQAAAGVSPLGAEPAETSPDFV